MYTTKELKAIVQNCHTVTELVKVVDTTKYLLLEKSINPYYLHSLESMINKRLDQF